MHSDTAHKLIVLVGPTGIGKTETAIHLARHFNCEILSSDSRQIFKEMKIGTAAPTDSELKVVPHHFIASRSIHEAYNASKFETDALSRLDELFKNSSTALMVGGSMLYVDAVCKGIDDIPDADLEIRKNLKLRYEKEGIESLRLLLKRLDPEYYEMVDLKNPARIIHALEICLTTSRPYSSYRLYQSKDRPFARIKIGLNCERELLHERINRRVDKMIEEGLEKEAQELYEHRNLTALNTVGYREFHEYFDGKITKNRAIELIKRNSRRYARKQLTWFRKDEEVKWFQPGEADKIIQYLELRGVKINL